MEHSLALSQDEIDLIRATHLRLSVNSQKAGEIFYHHLFDLAPDTEQLFVVDITSQAAKLMSTLGLVVSQLQNWRDLEPLVEDLALRHLAYGVQAEHYDDVGHALDRMMAEVLGNEYTDDVRAAWKRAYANLAHVMTEYAYNQSKTGGR